MVEPEEVSMPSWLDELGRAISNHVGTDMPNIGCRWNGPDDTAHGYYQIEIYPAAVEIKQQGPLDGTRVQGSFHADLKRIADLLDPVEDFHYCVTHDSPRHMTVVGWSGGQKVYVVLYDVAPPDVRAEFQCEASCVKFWPAPSDF